LMIGGCGFVRRLSGHSVVIQLLRIENWEFLRRLSDDSVVIQL
jgi:hypothetical protein